MNWEVIKSNWNRFVVRLIDFNWILLLQVQVALAAEPNNQDLLKLKEDLEELIRLQQELDESSGKQAESSSRKVQKYDETNHRWKVNFICGFCLNLISLLFQVGDRCMARNKNGNKQVATIDGISQDKAAISFSKFHISTCIFIRVLILILHALYIS